MAEMHAEALDVVRQGSQAPELVETRQAYMRYVGQGHEIAVDLPVEDYSASHARRFRDAFEAAYTKLYGRTISGIEIEVLSWTLTIAAPASHHSASPDEPATTTAPLPIAAQSCFDPVITERNDVPVFLRSDLEPGTRLEGPALITEDQTTTVVTSAYRAMIDGRGYIVLTRKDGADD